MLGQVVLGLGVFRSGYMNWSYVYVSVGGGCVNWHG